MTESCRTGWVNRSSGYRVLLGDADPDETRMPVPVKINGLPAHILLVHVVIVLLPVAALMLTAGAVWPAARRKLGFLTPAVALIALVFVPITTHAGHWLQDHLRGNEGHQNPQILKHVRLGGELLPWAFGIFVMAAAVWLLARRFDMSWRAGAQATPDDAEPPAGSGGGTATMVKPVGKVQALPVWVTAIVAVLAIAVSVGGTVQLIRIGDAGSNAVWNGRTTDSPSGS